ncbi:hypothetical protein [Pedobacter ginsengisoli]|nr:hypothetical protein [Pedobacter ginsengisoli]
MSIRNIGVLFSVAGHFLHTFCVTSALKVPFIAAGAQKLRRKYAE